MPHRNPFRIVTINTWKCDGDYAQRLQALGRQLAALDADAIALQESFSTTDGHIDTARHLAQHLGMRWHSQPGRRKWRQLDGQAVDSHSSLALLTRHPINFGTAIPLPSSDADGGRTAQICSLDVRGHAVLLVNVHLTHLSDGAALRARQLRAVLEHPVLVPPHDATWLCGDFNAALDSEELAPFLQPPWSLVNEFASAGGGAKTTHTGADGQGQDLDHILRLPTRTRADLRLDGASLVLDRPDPISGVWPSDHAGVSVTAWLE